MEKVKRQHKGQMKRNTDKKDEKTIVVDQILYDELVATDRKSISNFQFERLENDTRKQIKIINASFIPQILREVEDVFKS